MYLNCAEIDLEKIYNLLKSIFKLRYLIRATAPENKQNRFYTWLIAFDYYDLKYYMISNEFIYKLLDNNGIDYLIPIEEFKRKIQEEQIEIDKIKMKAGSDDEKNSLTKTHIKNLLSKTFTSILIHDESYKCLSNSNRLDDVFGILYGLNYSYKHNTNMANPPCKCKVQGCKCSIYEWEFSSGAQGGNYDGRLYACKDTKKVLVGFKKDYDNNSLADTLNKKLI